jgi:hypothetical protein
MYTWSILLSANVIFTNSRHIKAGENYVTLSLYIKGRTPYIVDVIMAFLI